MATNNSWNSQNPAQVAMGGTGNNALTANRVLLGNGGSPIAVSASSGSDGQVFLGATGAAPTFASLSSSAGSLTYTTGTNSLNIDIANFVQWTSWTPTLIGQSTAGTTTYTTQSGSYMRISNMVIATFSVAITAATGTGNINIGGLPFTFSRQTNGSCQVNGFTWPASNTMMSLTALGATSVLLIQGSLSAGSGGFIQIASVTGSVNGTIIVGV